RLQPGRDRHPAHCPVRQRGAVLPFPYGPQPGESPMALKENPRPNPWAARLHFLVRFAGLTGFVAAIAGLVIALVQNLGPDAFLPALQGESGDLVAQVAAYLLAVGGGLLLLLLLVEALVALVVVAGRRSVFGFNATLQVALAVALLIGVNIFSFFHYLRQ